MTTYIVHTSGGAREFATVGESNMFARRVKSAHMADPRRVGGRYLSGYHGTEYTVEAIELTSRGLLTSITVTDADGTRTHGTAWNARTDREVKA